MTSAARRAGIVRFHVEHIDRAAIGRFIDALPGFELRQDRDDAVLHACRFVADRDVEQIAEGEHAFGGAAGRRFRQIEVRQIGCGDF